MNKGLGVSGHRPKYFKDNADGWIYAVKEMTDAIARAYRSGGFKTFISGGAEGVDYAFADIIDRAQRKYKDIELELWFPHGGYIGDYWQNESRFKIEALSKKADRIVYVSENRGDTWQKRAQQNLKRNKLIVENSDAMIIVCNSDVYKGGTYHALTHANQIGKPVFLIDPIMKTSFWRNAKK